jgi:hypothetical protein
VGVELWGNGEDEMTWHETRPIIAPLSFSHSIEWKHNCIKFKGNKRRRKKALKSWYNKVVGEKYKEMYKSMIDYFKRLESKR